MGVCLSVRGVRDHRVVVNKGVREDATVNNRVICSRDTNIQTFYRRRAGVGFQLVAKVVVPRPWSQSDGEGGRVDDRTVSSIKIIISSSSLSACRKV